MSESKIEGELKRQIQAQINKQKAESKHPDDFEHGYIHHKLVYAYLDVAKAEIYTTFMFFDRNEQNRVLLKYFGDTNDKPSFCTRSLLCEISPQNRDCIHCSYGKNKEEPKKTKLFYTEGNGTAYTS